jgi:hypothetical protein
MHADGGHVDAWMKAARPAFAFGGIGARVERRGRPRSRELRLAWPAHVLDARVRGQNCAMLACSHVRTDVSAHPAQHPGGSGECLSSPSAMCTICVATGGSRGPMGVLGHVGELTRPAQLCDVPGAMGGPYHSPGVCAHVR